MMRILLALIVTLGLAQTAAAQASGDNLLRVGVRPDAVSMSYAVSASKRVSAASIQGPLGEAGYAGYMVFICDRALIALQREFGRSLRIEVVELSSSEIWTALEEGRVDIICGPTSATRDRLRDRISSAPLFISGVSYAARPPSDTTLCRPLVGLLASSTAGNAALNAIIASDVWRKEGEILADYFAGGSAWATYYESCDQQGLEPVRAFSSHDEIADAFCAGQLKYYVGDFEIVLRSIGAARVRAGNDCLFAMGDQTYSEERYVVLGNAREEDGTSHPSVAVFFEILSRQIYFQPSVLDEAFDTTFPGADRSRKLDLLYWALRGNFD